MLDEALKITGLNTATTQFPTVEFTDETHLSDDQLVLAVAAGDESAFEEIFEKYKRTVTRIVGRFFRDHSDIEECVQQCFVKVYFSVKSFRGGEDKSFRAWMTRVAVNVCYDEIGRAHV